MTGQIVATQQPRQTLADRLCQFDGIGPGFDHLRIGLSLIILLWHSFSNSYGLGYSLSLSPFPVPPLLATLLPAFFGLSGFLVMGSALRVQNVKTFFVFRALCIAPALLTEIMVSALLIGPLLTAVPLREYFISRTFFEYFGSLVGRVRFELPGVFADNPTPNLVNFALWTVAPEILCYVSMTALMVTGYFRDRKCLIIVAIGYAIICILSGIIYPEPRIGEVLPGRILILSFLTGAVAYAYRDVVLFSKIAALAAFAFALAIFFVSQRSGVESIIYFAIPTCVYVVLTIGLTELPRIPLLNTGDYSYGVYIYGFPIQQAVAYFLPEHREWWINFGISLPITLLVAISSWHLIERPFLELRLRFNANRSVAVKRPAMTLAILGVYAALLIFWNDIFPLRRALKEILGYLALYH